MKNVFLLLFVFCFALSVKGQSSHQWNYGIAANYSFERYHQTTRNFPPGQPVTSFDENVRPSYAFGGGFWAERRLSKSVSLYSRLDFHTLRVDRTFFNAFIIKVGGGRSYQEWHHSVALALAGRYYFPSVSKFRFYFDGGLKADRLIQFRNRYAHFDFRSFDPNAFNAVVPAWFAGVGIQHGRIGVSAEYQDYWNDALTRKMTGSERQFFMQRNISSKNITLNVSFRINK